MLLHIDVKPSTLHLGGHCELELIKRAAMWFLFLSTLGIGGGQVVPTCRYMFTSGHHQGGIVHECYFYVN